MNAPSPIQRLLDAEVSTLAPELAGLAGTHGLQLTAAVLDLPPTPMLGCWTRLRLRGGEFTGDLRVRADEALPFLDDSFCAVLLNHVLEHTANSTALLDEAARMLIPGGLLALTGFHPLSAWTPWLLCQGVRRPALAGPAWLRRRLATHGVQTYAVRRFGPAFPGVAAAPGQALLGGGFLLLARKRRAAVTPLRVRPQGARVPVRTFAPGARRECA